MTINIKYPLWLNSLQCDERFVFDPPSLFSTALSVVITNSDDLEEIKHLWTCLDFKENLRVVYTQCNCLVDVLLFDGVECKKGSCIKTINPRHVELISKRYAPEHENPHYTNIEYAYPQQTQRIVHKDKVNDIAKFEVLESVKRKLVFDEPPARKQRR